MPPAEPLIVTLDVGTSSARTLLFDADARVVAGFGLQLPYRITTTADGGVEIDPDELAGLAIRCLSAIHDQLREAGRKPAGIAFCTFWHNVLGVDSKNRPTTPILHLFDTRGTQAAKRIGEKLDPAAQHARTGCVLHPSYLPAKLLWLSEARPDAMKATARWMSFGEYFFLRLFGRPVASTSMVSGSGLWNQNQNDYDAGILSVLPIDRAQLAPPESMDHPASDLTQEFETMWPDWGALPWFPALGDGACNNIGSGCITPQRFSLMVGTTGVSRAVFEADSIVIPPGLWCYRVDRRRFVLGGALSNGGEVYAWMRRMLALPADEEQLEQKLATIKPGAHGLTVLPLFAGERSTKWRADARAAITGMSIHTEPIDLLYAGLESVSLRFRNIYDLMSERLGAPEEMIASGGALLKSRTWTQMMADALGRSMTLCLEAEATSRGAALLALERIGAIGHIRERRPEMGESIPPIEANRAIYDGLLAKQRRLYTKLFEEN